MPDWYEVQTLYTNGPDEWKCSDGYNSFMSPCYWDGSRWCLADDDLRPSPKGTTYPGNKMDRWRVLPPEFDPKSHKRAMRCQNKNRWINNLSQKATA
jgi:hypothetical protein